MQMIVNKELYYLNGMDCILRSIVMLYFELDIFPKYISLYNESSDQRVKMGLALISGTLT